MSETVSVLGLSVGFQLGRVLGLTQILGLALG